MLYFTSYLSIMRVLIVEDEHISAQKLERQLLQSDPAIAVAAKLQSVTETKQWLASNSCDLIFLDIHLSDGLSFEIFGGEDAPAPVIFTTAYDEYAIRAFKLNSIDYLLKPIGRQDIADALAKYRRVAQAQLGKEDIASIAQALGSKTDKQYQRCLLITSGEKIIRLQIAEVAYFFAETKHVFAVLGNGTQYVLDTPLDKLYDQLDPAQFYRANRKFIINQLAIAEMHAWSKSRIKLTLVPAFPEEIIISSERVKDFKDWLILAGQ